ncbi:MAG: hypothetical protein IJ598_10345 [Ruminococcus sp.]|nr:hypothetical protein [Ruminococcus sp.]
MQSKAPSAADRGRASGVFHSGTSPKKCVFSLDERKIKLYNIIGMVSVILSKERNAKEHCVSFFLVTICRFAWSFPIPEVSRQTQTGSVIHLRQHRMDPQAKMRIAKGKRRGLCGVALIHENCRSAIST